VNRATVHVDLANKSCYVASPDTFHGAWAPGVTRSTAEVAIAGGGWRFAPGSEWTLTVDGGIREVERHPVAQDDDLLNAVGSAAPGVIGIDDDELCALLLDFRARVEAHPIPELVDTEAAAATIRGEDTNRDFAVVEHTAHSAIVAARRISATVAADYDPRAQAAAELRQADDDLTALTGGAA